MTGNPTIIGTMGIPVMTIKPGTELPLRHELKHQINLREDLVLSQRLRKLFPHDKNAGPDGTYRVTSLYFDTPYDSALREKIDGVNRREKFRLRYYGTDTSFIRLEKKYKINGLCGKRSARMTQEQVKELLSGSSEFLLDSDEPLFIERPLRPGGFSLCARQCAYHVRSGYSHRAWKCGLPESGDFLHAHNGAWHGIGSQIRCVFAGACPHGGAGTRKAGDGLLQIRPMPAI